MNDTDSIRYDGDTWDLASSVGATATSVAASRALASQGPDALIHDPYADPLVKAVGVESLIRVANGEATVEDDPMLNRRRMIEQIAVRTRFFDDFFTNAARDGVRQAVILASGLDTRAYRLSWPAGTVVFELDQPQVIEFKTRVTLADLGVSPTAERRTIGIDLRDDWPTALRGERFRRQPADRVDRRGPADLSAAGGPGSAAGQHHRAVGPGQPVRHRVHGRRNDTAGQLARPIQRTSRRRSAPTSTCRPVLRR